jgi:hypothetical protein
LRKIRKLREGKIRKIGLISIQPSGLIFSQTNPHAVSLPTLQQTFYSVTEGFDE